MSAKQTEWKRIRLSKERIDFAGITDSSIEHDEDCFLALTLKLKCGRTVRIRKADYGVSLEEPVVPMQTKFLARTKQGLEKAFDSEILARDAIHGLDGEITEINVPVENHENDLPF